MKTILFPFQTTSSNEAAFAYAAMLTRQHQAKLVLLNSYLLDTEDENITPEKLATLTRRKWIEAIDEIHSMKGFYFGKFASTKGDFRLKHSYRIHLGKLQANTLKALEKEVFDLLVLNWSDAPSNAQASSASLANDLMEKSAVPILFVPMEPLPERIKQLIFLTDLQPYSGQVEHLEWATALSKTLDLPLEFVHVSEAGFIEPTKQNDLLKHINKLVACSDRYSFQLIKGSDKTTSIKNYLQDQDHSMLITVRKKRNFVSKLFHESVSGKLIKTCLAPTLVLKAK